MSLKLNPHKTKAIYFGTSHFVDQTDRLQLPEVEISDCIVVPFVTKVKSLGVILDKKLNWKSHKVSFCKKVNTVLSTLRFIRQRTIESLRIEPVQALVIPHLELCLAVYLDRQSNLLDRLQRLSSTFLRYILLRDTRITPYREKLGWLEYNKRRIYFMLIIICKILRLGKPEIFLFDRKQQDVKC